MASFVLDEIWDLIESVCEGFLTKSYRRKSMSMNFLCNCWKLLSIYRSTGEISSSLQNLLD